MVSAIPGGEEKCSYVGAEKTMTATDVTGFDAIFSTGFFAAFSRFEGARLSKLHINTGEEAKNPVEIRKILVSVKFLSAILGPEMGAPILWTPGKMRSFCRKTHVHKIPRFRGGGKCRFYFYGREDFSEEGPKMPIQRVFQSGCTPNREQKISPKFSCIKFF